MGEGWADNQFTLNSFNTEDVIHQTNGLCKLSIRNGLQTNIILGNWSEPILLSAKKGGF